MNGRLAHVFVGWFLRSVGSPWFQHLASVQRSSDHKVFPCPCMVAASTIESTVRTPTRTSQPLCSTLRPRLSATKPCSAPLVDSRRRTSLPLPRTPGPLPFESGVVSVLRSGVHMANTDSACSAGSGSAYQILSVCDKDGWPLKKKHAFVPLVATCVPNVAADIRPSLFGTFGNVDVRLQKRVIHNSIPTG